MSQTTLLVPPAGDATGEDDVVPQLDTPPDGSCPTGRRFQLYGQPVRRHNRIRVGRGDEAVRSGQGQKPGASLFHPYSTGMSCSLARTFEEVESHVGMHRGDLQR